MSNPIRKQKGRWWQIAALIVLAPLLLVVAVFALVFYLIYTVCLHFAVWTWWYGRGRDVLFVYSDSPIWHDYISEQILPHLGERSVVLNWSQRREWRFSLARMAFHHFGGSREFNPLAVVFRPLRRTRTFRFWQPFRDRKHGDPKALRRMESEFFDLIEVHMQDKPA
jgi:hypothetical protein